MTRNVAYLLGLFLVVCLGVGVPAAVADDGEDKQKTAYELQQQIEERQSAFAQAMEEADAATEKIDENEARIAEIEREIPKQQERSSSAARDLYKLQHESVGIVDLLLSANSIEDFINELEYINRVSQASVNEIRRLNEMKDELNAVQHDLRVARSEAETRAEDARIAMKAAQEAQAEVQRRIEEEARAQAEIAAMAAKLAEAPRDNNEGVVESSPEASGDSGGSAPETTEERSEPAPSAPSAPDMSGDEAAFVAQWAPRIDAYLAGSPLAGQGTTFARAAYQYGVDPRLSPAISFTESGKGSVCFLSHNAWGWGSASWDSWEEAIFDHVAGLSRGYGGQLTTEGAQKYCPPNWEGWYNRTLGQMELI